jgi:photosystem II stability/assembly factor-like uncharacterized protein
MSNVDRVVHVDYHAAWINPNDNKHIIVGNDGGVHQSRDRGQTWEHLNSMDIGQFYAVGFDFRKPYYVYGGLQDNNSWGGPTQSRYANGVTYIQWFTVTGGDGFYTLPDPNDWTTVYTESQGGALLRRNVKTGESRGIRPGPNTVTPVEPAGTRFRFNWQSPLVISPHNSRTLYFGGHKVFKSVNRGDSWKAISPDLTTNDPEKQKAGFGSTTPESTGAENHCTVVALSESGLRPGVVWAGTDDGRLQVTTDDGATWTDVYGNIQGLPKNAWCSRVHASKFELGRAYATFDNHRLNDFNTYVFMTEDYGKTWTKITSGLPAEDSAHVIREGTQNQDFLLLGTETGFYVSLDRGKSWSKFKNNSFPTVPVHDLAIHPRELDVVIGTHGRGIWTLNVAPFEQLKADALAQDVFLTIPQSVLNLGMSIGTRGDGDRLWVAQNSQPGTDIAYYVKSSMPDGAKIEIQEANGTLVQSIDGPTAQGLNVVRFVPRGRGLASGHYRKADECAQYTAQCNAC